MPSCSRIARRCRDRDASTSGVARGASATLARLPDLLGGPLSSPFGRDEVVVAVGLRPLGRLQLVESLDLESVRAQDPDPLPVRNVVLDTHLVGPLERV